MEVSFYLCALRHSAKRGWPGDGRGLEAHPGLTSANTDEDGAGEREAYLRDTLKMELTQLAADRAVGEGGLAG